MSTLPATMRTAMLTAYAGPQAIQLVERPVPQPGPAELLIKVLAAPINPSDQMFLLGQYGLKRALPVFPGFEGAGVVVAAGTDLRAQALLGRRVACAAGEHGGTWAEYVLTDVTKCLPLLSSVSTLRGSMLLVNPLTAWALVHIAQKQSPAIVQTAATGALGHMIQRLAKRFAIPIINIVRRSEQVRLLEAQGAAYVLNSSAADFDGQLTELCNQLQARVVLEAVAGRTTGRILQAMPSGSEAIVYGALSREAVVLNPGDLIFRDQRIAGFWLSAWLEQTPLPTLAYAAWNVQRLLDSDLASTVRAAVPLDHIQQALALYEQDMTGGKVLLLPSY